MAFHVPEELRLLHGPQATTHHDGNNGAFVLPCPLPARWLLIIASDGEGWEHVSVHVHDQATGKNYIPTWQEMCTVKDAFWDEEDVVIQYHPRKSEYRNCHPFTLHLWRPIGVALPTPDPRLVAPAPLVAESSGT